MRHLSRQGSVDGSVDDVVPPIILTGVIDIGRRHDVAISPWFDGVDIAATDPAVLGSARMSLQQNATVLARALDALPQGPLGLRVGGRDVLVSTGMLGVALSACETIAEALTLCAELHRAGGSLVDPGFEIDADEVAMTVTPRIPDPRLTAFLIEEALASTVVFLRTMLGTDLNPIAIEFPYAAPAYAPMYYRVFRSAVTFEADSASISYPASILERALPFAHRPTREAASEACRRLLRGPHERSEIIAAIEALLDRYGVLMTAADIARHLHVSERTLRRRLHSAGVSFSSLRDSARERRATLLLRESGSTIEAIARETGFRCGRDFRRAYYRWTGSSPSAVRRGGVTEPL
ncbi:AraC family transcriptional regulator ligand-binding domain-containing protein [Nocardia sp. NPDC005745]|uniref:AraC family transcriptional regulator n=1 Tax=Nocardia sp. NPDC005745 TaxID=3157061 RepID=UPI003400E2D1